MGLNLSSEFLSLYIFFPPPYPETVDKENRAEYLPAHSNSESFTHPYLLFIDPGRVLSKRHKHKNVHDKLLYPFPNVLYLSTAKAQRIKNASVRMPVFILHLLHCLRQGGMLKNTKWLPLGHKQVPKSAYLWHFKLTFCKIRGGEITLPVDKSYHKEPYTPR